MEKKELVFADHKTAFYCKNGQIFFNLKDLLYGLKNMSDETFKMHCNKDKNDFRLWIRDVLKDRKLARAIRWSTRRETIIKKIEDHLNKFYKI